MTHRVQCSPAKSLNLSSDARHLTLQITYHHFRIQTEHAVSKPAKLLLPPRVSAPRILMNAALNFHDQFQSTGSFLACCSKGIR
jgi:hypothetical protein